MNEIRPHVKQVNLVTPDVKRTVEFYALLGVEIPPTIPAYQSHHREMKIEAPDFGVDLDSTAFAAWWGGIAPGFSGAVVTLGVDTRREVDALHDRAVAAGHRSMKAPWDAFWGSRFAVVEDPDGNPVGIMSPRDDAHRSTPPDPDTFAAK